MRASKLLWERLRGHMGGRLREYLWCADAEVTAGDRTAIAQVAARVDDAPCAALPRVPTLAEPITLLNLLGKMGLPVAFWPRCKEAENDFCKVLEKSLGNRLIADIPLAVRDLRKRSYEAETPTPAHENLALLWDDPNRSAARARSGRFFHGVG